MIIVSLKRQKGVNKNVVAAIIHGEHKNILLNDKCLKAFDK